MERKVDVLAVMDEARSDLDIFCPEADFFAGSQMAAARSVVAELIEAARDVAMNRFHENPDECARSLDRLEAALSALTGPEGEKP